MKSNGVEQKLLKKFYDETNTGGCYYPKEADFDPPIQKDKLMQAGERLSEKGLITWKARRGTGLNTYGKALDGGGTITATGRAMIESPVISFMQHFLRHPLVICLVGAAAGSLVTKWLG